MKKLLNTLFANTPDTYLALDGENIVILGEEEELLRLPLHTLESIFYFGYKGASPALMGKCVDMGIRLSFLTPTGRYLASVCGENRGNILLRKNQYRISDAEDQSAKIARCFLFGKVYNSRWVLERALRDHPMRVDVNAVKSASGKLQSYLQPIMESEDMSMLRGYEGFAAEQYFNVFDHLLLQNKEEFTFQVRSRRPPLNRVNALLSFAYTLLANDCSGALEAVGLDPYAGFLHRDRPGRCSLALDLMEELRAPVADRFVCTIINNRVIGADDFDFFENGACFLKTEARRDVISAWQQRKQEKIKHPYLQESMEWGMVAFSQALLLARHLRGDLEMYPPFLWK